MAKYRAALIGCGGKGRDHTNTLIKNELWIWLPFAISVKKPCKRTKRCTVCQPYIRIIRRCLNGRTWTLL